MMNTCKHCGEQNSLGAMECKRCGKPLESIRTAPLDNSLPAIHRDLTTESREVIIALHIDQADKPLNLRIAPEVILGRFESDELQPRFVGLDDFDGYKKGVSRVHAAIRLKEDRVILVDLDSANGTYINGHRLQANEEIVLFDRDKILLGMLSTEVRFLKKEQTTAIKTGEVAKQLDLHSNTIRSWSSQYNKYLSGDATGETSIARLYSERDILVLKTIADLRGKGLNHSQVSKALEKQWPTEIKGSHEPIFLVPISEQDKTIDRIHFLEVELSRLSAERPTVVKATNIHIGWLVVAVIVAVAATAIVVVLVNSGG